MRIVNRRMHNYRMPPVAMAEPPESPEVRAASWGQGRRLEFVDFRLRWDGRINRADLTSFFEISVPQASQDIAKYLETAPDNATYDRSAKVYVSTPSFRPLFPGSSPAKYLDELLARATGVLQPELSFLGWSPTVAVATNPNRSVPADTLSMLLAAIRQGTVLTIRYQSMSSIQPVKRDIDPHALAHDGFRWHVRAYCRVRERYLDFVIARILGVGATGRPGKSGANDDEWQRMVPLVIAPAPSLSAAHKKVIELDYEMKRGKAAIKCRQALLFYVLRRLGLLDQHAAPSHVQQIVLKNRDAIAHLLPKTTGPR